MKRRNLTDEKGSVLILLAGAVFVMLGMAAMVADVGIAYLDRAKLAVAADAAALAAACELPHDMEAARDVAREYAQKNGVPPDKLEIEILPDRESIRIRAEKKMSLFFGRLFSLEERDLSAVSRARAGVVSAVKGIAPLAVEKKNFIYGEKYLLKQGAQEDIFFTYESPYHTGFFGALALGGSGASRYEENLTYGFNKVVSVGDVLPTESGNMSNPTKRAIDNRMERCTCSCTEENFQKNCPRILLVPVYEDTEGKKEKIKEIEVIGFAAFFVEEVLGQGNENQIFGYFVETTVAGEIGDNGTPYFGLRTSRLEE